MRWFATVVVVGMVAFPVAASACVDADFDGYTAATCGGTDCDDTDPNIHPGAGEICTDGVDNDCNGATDTADIGALGCPTCSYQECDPASLDPYDYPGCFSLGAPISPPHLSHLLNPDGTTHADDSALRCGKCHDASNFFSTQRYQCQRCHADPNDPSDPLNGVLRLQYPLPAPYGFGSAPIVKTHSAASIGDTKYGNWAANCVNCHNPHEDRQRYKYGTSIDKLLNWWICFTNGITGDHIFDWIEVTARTGPGSFADGPPHEENICETCHTQTRHHRRTGDAPGDLDASGTYVGHHDGEDCITCHPHGDGFAPTGGTPQPPHDAPLLMDNCQYCHVVDASGKVSFSTPIPNANCKRCHGYRDAHTSNREENPYASGKYTYDFKCVDCHDPMFPEGTNRKLIREHNPGSVVAGSLTILTTRTGPGSFADGPPHDENICETCHTQTDHHRHDGTAPGDLDAAGNYVGHHDNGYCMLCHDHSRAFMVPGPTSEYETPGVP